MFLMIKSLSVLCCNLFLCYESAPYKDDAGRVPAVDIFVTRINIVSLRNVACLCRLPDAQIVVYAL